MLSLPVVWMLSLSLSLPGAAVASSADAPAADQPAAKEQTDSFVWVTCGDEAAAAGDHSVVWVAASGDEAPAAGQQHRMILHKLGDEDAAPQVRNIEPGGPWLGIQFGPVAKPLAAHLKIESDVGQMVLNVAEGSPADTAGLQQFDVITQIDGQDASSKIGDFLEKVRAFNPNEAHTFSLLRGGQQMQVAIAIGTRPDDLSAMKYKYESQMEDLCEGKVFGRGGMLEKDDQGNWVFKGFNMKDMPDLFHAMPDVGDMDFQFNIPVPGPDGQDRQVFVYKNKGETLKIIREKDGKITVSRIENEDGKQNTTSTTYDNEDDLKARDADAYEAMTNGAGHRFGFFSKDGQWQDGMKHSEKAMKHYEKAMRRLHDGNTPMTFFHRKARTSFETTPDGRIRVTIRQGEDELIENYDSAAALQSAKPELYQKYEKFQQKTATKGSAR